MDNDILDMAIDFIIFLTGLVLLITSAEKLYEIIETMLFGAIR